ncbi:50S ribosomal protein L16 [Candidatus Uhrbacteria bacterium CG_4_10_14_0_8_um_filter_58_22]|uniref:Large ribosomal subunit protein uL16 n=1 Tax=Candidatus Uhrbacteria bacterium CG_4_10_14_0_8_um_filter_58_22 TaxID=1975029 RepID=A0A2M7Q9J7_9BACT|nr:MAG: 50S ribosomal protein L16 [Parcubacteria group bacterium CG1_02_58_44]PIY62398.1 MAG: 50S ribosomal protein L16 [Candidatus Uhrbacteria bacterium CG_4_10_14_0_8_um_filter_58_22]
MLLPAKVKYRKMHKGRGRNKRKATTKLDVSFGGYGLKAMDGAWVTSRQIEAARRAMTRYIKRGGKIWIRIFPDKPITFHGNENTMGSGKGAVDHYVAVIRPGTVMFEMDGIPEETAREAMRLAGHKLPMRTKFIVK